MFKKAVLSLSLYLAATLSAQAGLIGDYGINSDWSNGSINGSDGGKNETSTLFNSSSLMLLGEFSEIGYLPILKAKSTDGTARITAIQSFQYTGLNPFDLDINIDLHGTASGNSSIRADIGLLFTDSAPFIEDYYFGYSFSTIAFEPSDGYLEDYTSLYISDETDVNKLGKVSATVQQNQWFYVVTQLRVRASDGGLADAYNTLNMSFNSTANLASSVPVSSVSVSEPASLGLAALALMGLATTRRKTNSM